MKQKIEFKWLLLVLLFIPDKLFAITLDECQRLARENYPQLKQYEVTAMSLDADDDVAVKNYLPQINVYGQASWKNNVTAFPDNLRNVFGSMGVNVEGLSKDQYNVGAELNQIIWDGGATKVERKKAESDASIADSKTDVEMYKITNAVNDLYFNILLYDSQIAINKELEKVLVDNLSTMEANRINGLASESDIAIIKAQLLETQRDRITLEHTLKANKHMLGIYVGQNVDEEQFEYPVLEDVFTTDATNRPEMRMYEARRNGLKIQKQSINSSIMPQIRLFANGYYGKPGLDMFDAMFYDKWSFNFMAGIKVQWNIGEFYRKADRMKRIDAMERNIDIEQEVFKFNISLLTEQQQIMIEGKRKEIDADREIVNLREDVRMASEAKLRDGVIIVNDLLRDIMNENNARIAKNIHETELLHLVYKLKYTVNQ